MRRLIVFVLAISMHFAYLKAQEQIFIHGRVQNQYHDPLAGAVISAHDGKLLAVTGSEGDFSFYIKIYDQVKIFVSFIGFKQQEIALSRADAEQELVVLMVPLPELLEEVVIVNNYSEVRSRTETVTVETADRSFIRMHRGGSLMTSVGTIPGVSSIEIGSGHSKPLIRGLGFNRIVVVENGIRHEGQQWGADHGLEIDQYAVERIEVIKGPASVMYGSGAIGGVMRVYPDPVPASNTLSGNVEITGKSNNNLIGGSTSFTGRSNRLFFTSRFTMLDYADYRIPADSVEIYSFLVPLNERRLRNTAGNEMNLHASAGWVSPGLIARISASMVNSRSGFFANAHGLEPRRVNTELYDLSDRDIMYPAQEVSHLKLAGQVTYENGGYRLEGEAGYQNNFRQEKNHYVNHGYMPAVFPGDPDSRRHLEREFDKDIFTLNIRNFIEAGERHNLSLGVNAEYQDNRIGGYAFIIPEFRQMSIGTYLYDRIEVTGSTSLHAGVRFDQGRVRTEGVADWFATPVEDPVTGEVEKMFLTRADAIDRTFNSLSISAGLIYNGEQLSFKANLGKGFRMPTPKELAANGVNYHYFRYEKGNSSLVAEESWQVDMNFGYDENNWSASLSPFLSYFPGYIYLDPSYRHDFLYGAGNQVFEYAQNEVIRFGGEVRIKFNPVKNVSAELTGDYVYSEQLSGNKKGFTIPFSPPPSVRFSTLYSPIGRGILLESFAGFDFIYTGRQTRIVPPEKETPSYELVHLVAGGTFSMNNRQVEINFRIHNLLNRKYLNHVSYYRLINAPEAGRNFILSVKVPLFGNKR